MTQLTKIAARKKIVQHLRRRGHVADFKVTPVLVMRWWNLLNKALFDGKLRAPHTIEVKAYRNAYGYCTPMAEKGKVRLKINSEFYDRKEFITILAHEMIHQWQWTELYDQARDLPDIAGMRHEKTFWHGRTFWQWKKILKQSLDLPLYESY